MGLSKFFKETGCTTIPLSWHLMSQDVLIEMLRQWSDGLVPTLRIKMCCANTGTCIDFLVARFSTVSRGSITDLCWHGRADDGGERGKERGRGRGRGRAKGGLSTLDSFVSYEIGPGGAFFIVMFLSEVSLQNKGIEN